MLDCAEVVSRQLALLGLAGLLAAAMADAAPAESGSQTVKVLSLNAWHGLRTEGKFRFPGESRERSKRRLALQLDEIRALDPDLLLLQEVNPNPRRSRRYARELGYDQLHKVTSCGIHFGPFKIPVNMNEGLTILARPELGLRKVGFVTLSGKNRCWGDYLGFQTAEARFVLLGEITLGGRRNLVGTTHLHAPPFVQPDFEERLDELVAAGKVTAAQQREILDELDRHRRWMEGEAEALAAALREAAGGGPVILGGDLNAEPDSGIVATVAGAGIVDVAAAARPGEPLYTYDPVRNAENNQIGAKKEWPLDDYGVPELAALYEARKTTLRRIDYVFASPGLEPAGAEVVLDRDRDGLFPSDHFGLLVELRLPE